MSIRKMAGVIVMVAFSIISCKKNTDTTTPKDQKLVVDLSEHLIGVADIDSANVVLRKGGTSTPYFLRFQKGSGKLEASIDGLPAGNYTVDFDLYTKEMTGGKKYQFVSVKQLNIQSRSGTLTVSGPDDLDADGWTSRKVVTTANNDIVVLIPLDVNDPYFEIRTKGIDWDFFSVERLALQGQAVIAHETWNCQNNNCPGNNRIIFNKTHFFDFTETVKNSTWTRSEIIITVGNIHQQLYNEFGHDWNN